MSHQEYDLELARVVQEITDSKSRKIIVQLADGLKPNAKEIQEYIQTAIPTCEIYFWLGSCYGKCDIPEIIDGKNNDYDMLIQFGH
jgi:diphthamide biosynthesis enzyme Dph1/Dph2-like protein